MSAHCIKCDETIGSGDEPACESCRLRIEGQLREAQAVLRELEWQVERVRISGDLVHRVRCPTCQAYQDQGHAAGCPIASVLGRRTQRVPA